MSARLPMAPQMQLIITREIVDMGNRSYQSTTAARKCRDTHFHGAKKVDTFFHIVKHQSERRRLMEKSTPMMQQYEEARSELPPNTLLFFRLGDFYELFNEDARLASRVLNLTLTQRQGIPMAGIPYHATSEYVRRLLSSGHKVAICDQLEPATAGKIVQRAITRIYSPGTVIEEDHIEACEHHYILAFNVNENGIVAAWMDLSEGELKISSSENIGELLSLLSSFNPREILIAEGASDMWEQYHNPWLESFNTLSTRRLTTELPNSYFNILNARQMVYDTFGVLSLGGFAIDDNDSALSPAGALLRYASQNLRGSPKNVRSIHRINYGENLFVDATTVRSLEIFHSSRNKREGSLVHAIDRTQTAAGARLLREYLSQPISDVKEIDRRQTFVQEFIGNLAATNLFRDVLRETSDMVRMLGRLQNGMRSPRDVGGILATLEKLPRMTTILRQIQGNNLSKLLKSFREFEELRSELSAALEDTLPTHCTDGGYIRKGFDEQLDHWRSLLQSNEQWLSELEKREQEATGIRTLRIKNNGAFGYFIEISKSYLRLVPSHYIRRQTMVNGERYITEELREKEREIVGAKQHALMQELEVFERIVLR
ncbi:MAG: DNA mismatch repair protein MutS, partial [Puniceicoccales bacterium]|nr:DNA mismatch repair protein MutS [Puniceicoccales bacterium]